MIINKILKLGSVDNYYMIGTLESNEVFTVGDDIFFVRYDGEIIPSKVVGVELFPEVYPDYVYKITVPENYVSVENDNYDNTLRRLTINCDQVFGSLNDAEKGMLDHIKGKYNLEKSRITDYFNQFKQ